MSMPPQQPTTPVEAFEALCQLAAKRRSITYDEVFPGNDDYSKLGNGFHIRRSVPVALGGGPQQTQALLVVYIIRTAEGTGESPLHLRTALSWISQYGEHESFARYNIDPIDGALSCDASWTQTYPYDGSQDDFAPEAMDTIDNYHARVIINLTNQREPDLACMLRFEDDGEFDPVELVGLHRWLAANQH
jgi:hypothetical protein